MADDFYEEVVVIEEVYNEDGKSERSGGYPDPRNYGEPLVVPADNAYEGGEESKKVC